MHGGSKAGAVELYRAAGPDATYAQIARELGCDIGSLSKWVQLDGNANPSDPEANPFQIAEENRRLRRENAHSEIELIQAMRIERKPAQEMQVDYVGNAMEVVDIDLDSFTRASPQPGRAGRRSVPSR